MYRLPAEWAPQSAVMLTWPHEHSDWAARLAEVEPVFVNIARETAKRQRVIIACHDETHREYVRDQLADHGVNLSRIALHSVPSNDTWARDHGPLTVLDENQRPVLLDFVFNGWGNKFPSALDNAVTRGLHASGAFGNTPLSGIDFVLEGGSVESDGQGTVLTTRACLLAPTRNPGYNQQAIEHILHERLGAERVLWLTQGHLAGDDTDSHIDTLARFCDAHTIAYVKCSDPHDEHYAALAAMEAEIQTLRQADGTPYRWLPLPWPQAKYDADGRRLPATYANFLIINHAVLLPTYRDAADAEALAQLRTAFPQRTIVPIDCLPLIHQNGSLHCITMQLPREVLE